MKNADRHKPCNFYVKGPNHRETGVAFFVHLAPGGTVTSPTFHPWDPRWLSNCPHWLPIVILGFKIVIFSTFHTHLYPGNCSKMHSLPCVPTINVHLKLGSRSQLHRVAKPSVLKIWGAQMLPCFYFLLC